MHKRLLTAVALFVFFLGFSVLLKNVSADPLTGAVFTTDSTCTGVNLNHYLSKGDVYLDGGPDHPGSAGLPDGDYYVQVTNPSGSDLLGTSVGSSNEKPVHVTNGVFDECYQLSAILIKASDITSGYDDTTNNGGGYKVWVSTVSTFENDQTKTDNFKVEASLIIIKQVINDNGGEAVAGDFTINVTATNPFLSFFFGSETGTTITLDPGSYSVDEGAHVGYTKSLSADCSGIISSGQEKTCTITNDDIPPRLHLRKVVINDNGGAAAVTDWTLSATGKVQNSTNLSGATPVDSDDTFKADTYILAEVNGPTGYLASDWVCVGGKQDGSSIVLDIDEEATCTVTNDDIQPKLTLIKHVVNDNGGTLKVSDFPLFVDLTQVTSGVINGFNAGTYTTSETQQTGYSASSWSGDCASDGSITLAVGDNKTCEITNDDISPVLTIVKDADPNDCQDFTFNMTGQDTFLLDDDSAVTDCADTDRQQSTIFNSLNAGQNYTITEAMPDNFWFLKNVNCVATGTQIPYAFTNTTNGVTISMALADNVTCAFLNKNLAPTRTQGFWQTHTDYTSTVFANLAMQKYIGQNIPHVSGITHKGQITNILATGQSQLFGAYYSNISKKSNNQKRSVYDQTRMVLLQQLVTAKLNCAAFGCPSTVQNLITGADNAYKLGVEMQFFTSSLDTYNNSGDTIIISGSPGKATPKTSQSYANIIFWDTP